MNNTEPELLLIDTDAGADDAGAIMLALRDKNIAKVLAVTCCFGNTSVDNVCANVMRVLTVCGEKNIPVHRGCSEALIKGVVRTVNEHDVFGTDGLGNVAHEFSTGDLKESDLPASLAMIELVRKYPKKINLIAIGPLTNIAIAHRIYPQLTQNLKSIVCLGGNYKGIGNITEVAEFNFYQDPEAAHMILSEVDCPLMLVPWETVVENGIPWDSYEKLVCVPTVKGQFIERINEFYIERSKKKGNKRFFDCDTMAVAALLYPECITSSFERFAVVECGGSFSRGLTVLRKVGKNKVKIVTHFNEEILNKIRASNLL